MKKKLDIGASDFDADASRATIDRPLSVAGLGTSAGPLWPLHDLNENIRRALASGRLETADAALDAGSTTMPPKSLPGSFKEHNFSNDAGSRVYKVYVPPASFDAPLALVVMLHGCTQSADDFAAGTQMNRLAQEHGFMVVYPEQAAGANAFRCWNWFQPQDQLRGVGEPSLIAGIVSEVMEIYGVNPQQVFCAGLSAGGAMAVVMGETYPELFAGVGVHSGLPYGSAHDTASAMAAMKGGRSGIVAAKSAPAATALPTTAVQAVPVIVFHGDRDHTVQQSNSAQIVQQASGAYTAHSRGEDLSVSAMSGVTAGGRRFSRSVHTDTAGQIRIEDWILHGAGHSWSGGNASGSYTDSRGPDASAEMVRFFLALPPEDMASGSAGSPDGRTLLF